MVLARNGSVLAEFSGSVEGHMLTEPAGEGGFGYDPLFVPEGHELSFAQLPMEVKNSMSHRAPGSGAGGGMDEGMPGLMVFPGIWW